MAGVSATASSILSCEVHQVVLAFPVAAMTNIRSRIRRAQQSTKELKSELDASLHELDLLWEAYVKLRARVDMITKQANQASTDLLAANEHIVKLEHLAKLSARLVIDANGVLWIGDGVGYVPK